MSFRTHFLTNSETESVANALYHEGYGWLSAPCFVANIPDIIGSPADCLETVEAVLNGTYRGFFVKCSQADCEECR